MDSPYDQGVLERAEALLADLSRMRSVRDKLIQQLKDDVSKDEITDLLVINKNNEAAVFNEVCPPGCLSY